MGHVSQAPNSYGRGANLNANVAQNPQSRVLSGEWCGAARFGGAAAADAGKGVAAICLVGGTGVNEARLQAQVTSQNIDHLSLGKRYLYAV
ncbi:hypothetical protein FGB62_18g24 [Gracilaria domingensis]|nr:hypothetical protein FGB62_18g24 [Gracilaria domingensis]